jgi:Fe-S cluster assembly protein SufB
MTASEATGLNFPDQTGDFSYAIPYAHDTGYGLDEGTVRRISRIKNEPPWLLDFRLRALRIFRKLAMPSWSPIKKEAIDFSQIRYYLAQADFPRRKWEDVPDEVKKTFDRLGVPEKERRFLAGVEAQFDSEMAYENLREDLRRQGVIFVNSTEGLLHHEAIFRPFFSTIVPVGDNPFAALNGAVFSGGSFIYVPPGIKLSQPLQAYFRINAEQFGQFERTLIIVDRDAELTYLEGCTAPRFETATLHAAVVELVALPGARLQYITVQNWSNNVYNLVTKRGKALAGAKISWIDGNIGSHFTMKYPAVLLAGEGACGEVVSLSVANGDQHQDTGARMIHLADRTTSHILAKSLSLGRGIATYRGTVALGPGVSQCRSHSRCDAILLDETSVSRTYPQCRCQGRDCTVEHEASVSKISDEQLFFLRQRGIPEIAAKSLLVNGFFNELIRSFPMEYGVELKRLLEMEVEDSHGREKGGSNG